MTIHATAKQIGITSVFLSRLLGGQRRVGAKSAQRIAAHLGESDWRKFVHIPGTELRKILNID